MKKIWYFAALLFIFTGCSNTSMSNDDNTDNECEKTSDTTIVNNERLAYEVATHEFIVDVDGELEEVWSDVSDIRELEFPWDEKEAPETVFRAFVADDIFYFAFEVKDEEILLEETWVDEKTLDNEDRVELFFAASDVDQPVNYEILPYYAIEIDAAGRVHDYLTYYYRNMDNTWNMDGLVTAASIGDNMYIVEGSIPVSSLDELGLIVDGVIRVGVFRAEFSYSDTNEIIQEWISWVDPMTVVPDFHVDSAFGEFILK